MTASITVEGLHAWYGQHQVLKDVHIRLEAQQVTAVIGPSGCGKSTFIRCLNRLHETAPATRVRGRVLLGEDDVYALHPTEVRRRIGMVFQKPNPFPASSIFDNIALALRLAGVRRRAELSERVEKSLRMAALWDEVKDRLHQPATALSGGQQQRLCIARALAMEPQVLLMDEPTSALDPASTERIERLILELKERYTVVIVTHNLSQALRVAESTAFFMDGSLVEYAPTKQLFAHPTDPRTKAYIGGPGNQTMRVLQGSVQP